MNIPFKLNFFKQIEIYQDLNEFDRQFSEQVRHSINECKNPPLWFFEKKVLYWAYMWHKHLSSPLRVSDFTHREKTYEYIHKNSFDDIVEDDRKETPTIQERQRIINYTDEEIKCIQIRKVFGNLEARGFAKFFKQGENNYLNIHQENCDGIFITQKGLEYAKMIYYLYQFRDTKGDYTKIKGVEKVLEIKQTKQIQFIVYITVSILLILGSIFLFFYELIQKIIALFV